MTEFILKYWLQVLFGVVTLGVGALAKKLWKRIISFFDNIHESFESVHLRLEKIEENQLYSKYSDKVILEDRLLQAHRYYTQKRYCTAMERQLIMKLHKAYKKAGGNGAMEEIIRDICDLPFKPPGE